MKTYLEGGKDQRREKRMLINREALLFYSLPNGELLEQDGEVVNISLNGIELKMKNTSPVCPEEGDEIEFQYIDEDPYLAGKIYIVQGVCHIKHIRICGEYLVFGGIVQSSEYHQYAENMERIDAMKHYSPELRKSHHSFSERPEII